MPDFSSRSGSGTTDSAVSATTPEKAQAQAPQAEPAQPATSPPAESADPSEAERARGTQLYQQGQWQVLYHFHDQVPAGQPI